MRVVVTEAFRAYLDMQPFTLEKGQEIKGSTAVYLLEQGAPVEPLDDEARAVAEGPAEKPADGNSTGAGAGQPNGDGQDGGTDDELDINAKADDVLAWVGDDPDRAAEALQAEQAKDKPRSTLVKQLEKLTSPGES